MFIRIVLLLITCMATQVQASSKEEIQTLFNRYDQLSAKKPGISASEIFTPEYIKQLGGEKRLQSLPSRPTSNAYTLDIRPGSTTPDSLCFVKIIPAGSKTPPDVAYVVEKKNGQWRISGTKNIEE